jgi:hypothetical protein
MVMLRSQELEFVTLNAFNEILRQSRPREQLSSRTFLLEVIRVEFLRRISYSFVLVSSAC